MQNASKKALMSLTKRAMRAQLKKANDKTYIAKS